MLSLNQVVLGVGYRAWERQGESTQHTSTQSGLLSFPTKKTSTKPRRDNATSELTLATSSAWRRAAAATCCACAACCCAACSCLCAASSCICRGWGCGSSSGGQESGGLGSNRRCLSLKMVLSRRPVVPLLLMSCVFLSAAVAAACATNLFPQWLFEFKFQRTCRSSSRCLSSLVSSVAGLD